MRQQDSGGPANGWRRPPGRPVTQATSYQGSEDGAYREAPPCRGAAGLARRLERSDVTDRGRGDRAVRRPADLCARVPRHHRRYRPEAARPNPDVAPPRPRRGAPPAGPARPHRGRHRERRASARDPRRSSPPGLGALLRGFREAGRRGGDARACAHSALEEIGRVPEDLLCSSRPPQSADGSPVTSVTPMLSAATTVVVFRSRSTPGLRASRSTSVWRADSRRSSGPLVLRARPLEVRPSPFSLNETPRWRRRSRSIRPL